jgi:hypothetical protein
MGQDPVVTRVAADTVVLLHLAFILFVAVGGLLVLRWPKLAWFHLPAAVWGALVELTGWICPLTPLENRLRVAAGGATYSGGFIERYIMPIVYPPGFTRSFQIGVGLTVIGFNLLLYGWILRDRLRATRRSR